MQIRPRNLVLKPREEDIQTSVISGPTNGTAVLPKKILNVQENNPSPLDHNEDGPMVVFFIWYMIDSRLIHTAHFI